MGLDALGRPHARFAAIGAGRVHFQTLYGWDPSSNTWYVCNNNSTGRVDRYTWSEFRSLHLSSGRWVVILDAPRPPQSPVRPLVVGGFPCSDCRSPRSRSSRAPVS